MTIQLLCVPSVPPDIVVTGPCRATQVNPVLIAVSADGLQTTGTCQITLTFANGATSTTTVTAAQKAFPCGCGEQLVVTPSEVLLGSQCTDAGMEGGASG
jgi:hypothetical protein